MYRLIMLALLLLAASCGAPGAVSEPPSPSGRASATATAPPELAASVTVSAPSSPALTPAAGDILVSYRRSGGITGSDETLTVYQDGRLELHSTAGGLHKAQAAPEQLSQLRALLTSDAFAQLAPHYPNTGADLISYELTVPAGSGAITVVTMDGAAHPPILDEVLTLLDDLAAGIE